MTITSTGTCATSRAARYSKQLVSHMSRRHGGEWDSEADRGYILFPTCVLHSLGRPCCSGFPAVLQTKILPLWCGGCGA